MSAGLTALSHTTTSGSNSLSGNTLTCYLGTLDAGAGARVTFTASPDRDGVFFNTATVAGTFTDLNPANNSAAASVVVHKEAQLSSTFVQGGFFHLDISAHPGTIYGIQTSTNLTSWSWVATNVVPGHRHHQFHRPGYRTSPLLSRRPPDALMKVLGLTGGVGMGKSAADSPLASARRPRRRYRPSRPRSR